MSREDLKGFRVPTLIAILSFAYVLGISWGVSPAADGYRYLSAARYVADTGNLLGEWPHTHINPASFREPRLGIALLSLAYMAGGEAGSRILLAAFAALCVYPAYLILSALTDRRMALLGSALWVFVPVNTIWTSFFYIDLIAAFFGYLGLWGLIKIDSDEGGWKPLAVFTAAMFSISIMCRRTSIIYVFLLSATLVSSAVLRRKAGRVLRLGVILALVLTASAIWVPDYVSSGFRENQWVEPSLSHLLDAKLWAGQFLGVFSQVNGFTVGDVATNWMHDHTAIFAAWAIAASFLAGVFALGLVKGEENLRYWTMLCMASLLVQIAYIQYSTRQTGMTNSLGRFLLYVYPILILVFLKGVMAVRTWGCSIIRRVSLPVVALSLLSVTVVGIVNVGMRDNHVAQCLDLLYEAREHLSPGPVASNSPHELYYQFYPRLIHSLDGGNLSVLVSEGVRQIILVDGDPGEALAMGFSVHWTENRTLKGYTGGAFEWVRVQVLRLP